MSSLASSRLAVIAASLVTATLGSLAFADSAYTPPPNAGAPAMRRMPVQEEPAQPTSHYAKPPPARPHHVTPAPEPTPEPAMNHAQLVNALRADRERNLAAFRAYETAGVYPSNTYTTGSLNVWRDRDGHFCAAATIIAKSGSQDLVQRVADQNNYIKLADVQQGPLEDWILTSGFTQEELVAIQKPFNPVARPTVRPQPPQVDPDMRSAETARLKKIYQAVEAQLVADEDKSLDLAADRLLKHPTLAWRELGYTTAN